jgi:hypothetical protein
MRIRMSPYHDAGVMARAMLRKMALGITLPTSILVPLFGLMLVEDSWGGLDEARWARDAYILFWIVWAVQIAPDILRYARDVQRANPRAGVMNAAMRGVATTVIIVVNIVLMATKYSILPF